jgi:hypothetical protein
MIFRNPATAGRRMSNSYAGESQRKTILTYPGIITWTEHEQICARMDSRTHRKGISPANAYLLTSILFDEAGHVLYHVKASHGQRIEYYYCQKGCGICPPMKEMDDLASQAVIDDFGDLPYMVRRIIPGKNHFEEIARLRQDRAELDDLADDYSERHSVITVEIRRLAREDKENPLPNEIKWVESGQTIEQYWQSLSTAGRRDWLKENGWKIHVAKSDGEYVIAIDAGFTAEISADRQSQSLGFLPPGEPREVRQRSA